MIVQLFRGDIKIVVWVAIPITIYFMLFMLFMKSNGIFSKIKLLLFSVFVSFILPSLCLGFNPFIAKDCSLSERCLSYGWSNRGVWAIKGENGWGLRDRYSVILPATNNYKGKDRLGAWNRYYDSNCKCYIEAGWKFDTLIINKSLIDSKETEFVDYNVEPGKTYYYFIKQMTTSLSSYDLSNPVAATPLTASKGDANGSMTVDVADVVTQVAWLTNQNPQPFIFEAADLNADGVVNILDVVATINIIMNPSLAGIMSVDNTATYYIENGILYVETPVALGGVQFSFVADKDAEIKPLEALDGFEKVTNWTSDTELMFMAYSMSGKTIPAGRHALLEIGDAELSDIVLSDTQGHNVMPINGTTTNLGVVEQMQMSAPYPNPFRQQVVVPYLIGQSGEHAVRMVFTDVAGRTIDVYTTANDFGSYSYTWTPAEGMQPGVYFVSLYVDDKLMQTSKIVYIQ